MKCSCCNQQIRQGDGFYKLPADVYYCMACHDLETVMDHSKRIAMPLAKTEDVAIEIKNQ